MPKRKNIVLYVGRIIESAIESIRAYEKKEKKKLRIAVLKDSKEKISKKIREKIEKEGIDLVVLSTEGRKGHFGFGSVAEKVVKNATVPVVSVPGSGMRAE